MGILAIDYGQKRLGLAVSDPLGITAQPAGFVLNDSAGLTQLSKIIEERNIRELVLGLPKSLNGQDSAMTEEVRKFAIFLEQKYSLPVHFWDERLTTAESERLLISGNVRRDKRKESRDTIAAALILQGYLATRGQP